MWNRLLYLTFITWLPLLLPGQPCHILLGGEVLDKETGAGLSDAVVSIDELNLQAFTNEGGKFQFTSICAGAYHLSVSHLGCAPFRIFAEIKRDTNITLYLHHHSELINEVEVTAERDMPLATQTSTTLRNDEILAQTGKNLTQTFEEIAGVSSLNNGSGISKPVIQGMWGNRVSIINNGIAQAGQQWGVDHAPEIDPFVAQKITVIKGASALQYGGVSLGGVVLIEPGVIKKEPHIHGLLNYGWQSNGRGNTLNAQAEQGAKWASWRINGTLKVFGDRSAPGYYLTNTGNRETNFAATLQKNIGNRLTMQAYYSLFGTEIGILRGAHIANLTDLEAAIYRDEPFFTSNNFSYNIGAPRQRVQHHLLKLETKYLLNDKQFIKLTYGGQLNHRDEFDVRRADRSDSPALSIAQQTQFAEANYTLEASKNFGLNTGVQFNYVDNTNDNAATGRLPLIPDYRSYQSSAYVISHFTYHRLHTELGARADHRNLEALTISTTLPRTIIRKNHTFNNFSLGAGAKLNFKNNSALKLDLGLVQRQPEVNELYSFGLHQGLASLEYGNPNLTAEKSLKAALEIAKYFGENWFLQWVNYYHRINGYIFLNPTGTFELNIAGSFPVYAYTQTDARLVGSDLVLTHHFNKNLSATVIASFLQGDDVTQNKPLVFMPANNALFRVRYTINDRPKWQNTFAMVSGKYVAKQNHLLAEQDFLAPPNAYFLLGFSAGTTLTQKTNKIELGMRIENMLNTTYRDYLNRLRYFADDLGVNVVCRIGYRF